MTREELLKRRWGAVLPTETQSIDEAVARLGAVQAQDYNMGVLAVGLRSRVQVTEVEEALNSGRLVRTHVLRPTWHIVAAPDLRWMMELTKPRIEVAAGSGYRQVGLTPEIRTQARGFIEQALQAGPLTREEILAAVEAGGLSIEGLRSVHYMMDAELHLLVCNGPRRGKSNTYDLVDRRIAPAQSLNRDEALARLVLRYLTGHGPATERDLSWWSGLGLIDVRRGLEANRASLATADYDGSEVWYVPEGPLADLEGFLWLPAYDESLVAFADRTAVLDVEDATAVLTKNGIFNPIIIHNGRIAGTWKRTLGKKTEVEALWFGSAPPGGEESRLEWEQSLRVFLQS